MNKVITEIVRAIYDKKGSNILVLDVKELSTLTDNFIIAEGGVERHVIALAKAVIKTVRENGGEPIHVEGMDSGNWVVVDCGEMIVHLFLPKERERYNLEELWRGATVIDCVLTTDQEVE